MRKSRLFGLVIVTVLGLGGTNLAQPLYTWEQVVERGMPDLNDPLLIQEAFATDPIHLSFPSGVRVSLVLVWYEGQTYAVYYGRARRLDVVGIARVDEDLSGPQGLRYDEFYVDSGLLRGVGLTGQFLYFAENHCIFEAVCRIAEMSKEARVHRHCPRKL